MYFERVLKDCDGNAAAAASVMQIPTSTFYGLMKKYKIGKSESNFSTGSKAKA
jgi:DNA-binding NtrC family response regulator